MKIEAHREATHHRFSIAGELTEREYDQFNQEIYSVVEQDSDHVILDVSALSYISSSGLGTLVRLYNLLVDRGCCVCLVAPRENVGEVVRQTRMDQIFRLHDDLAGALAGLPQKE